MREQRTEKIGSRAKDSCASAGSYSGLIYTVFKMTLQNPLLLSKFKVLHCPFTIDEIAHQSGIELVGIVFGILI
jgi:hypothetical protein